MSDGFGTSTRVALALAVSLAFSAAPARADDDGRSAFDLRVERLLATGEIAGIEPLPGGTTHPRRVTLRGEGVQLRAIFKTVDEELRVPSRTSRVEMHFTDRHVYDVAAYRLDRLLGIGLVPPAVQRTIGGEAGTLQYWIEDAITMGEAIERGSRPRDERAFLERTSMMNLLDALIFNIDRNPGNILVTPGDDGFHLIDHTRGFREDRALSPLITDWNWSLPGPVRERLESLTRAELERALGGTVSKRQIAAVWARRALVLERLGKR